MKVSYQRLIVHGERGGVIHELLAYSVGRRGVTRWFAKKETSGWGRYSRAGSSGYGAKRHSRFADEATSDLENCAFNVDCAPTLTGAVSVLP